MEMEWEWDMLARAREWIQVMATRTASSWLGGTLRAYPIYCISPLFCSIILFYYSVLLFCSTILFYSVLINGGACCV